jgi:hypothetical protein
LSAVFAAHEEMSIGSLLRRWPLLLLLSVLMLGGCETGNLEEDAFFNRGWWRPSEMDNPSLKSEPVTDSMPPGVEDDD